MATSYTWEYGLLLTCFNMFNPMTSFVPPAYCTNSTTLAAILLLPNQKTHHMRIEIFRCTLWELTSTSNIIQEHFDFIISYPEKKINSSMSNTGPWLKIHLQDSISFWRKYWTNASNKETSNKLPHPWHGQTMRRLLLL